MMNHYQSRILAEAVKHGGTNISKIGKMAQSINEEPVLTGGEAAPTRFGWSKHQFEAKFRELLTRMGFERGIIHIKTEGQEMKMYFANAAKARDFVVAFNGLARRKSMGSVASVATQFNKIKSPTGTNAIVSLDLSVVRGESLDLDGTDLYEWFSEETETITEGTEVRVGKFVFETQKDGWAIHGSIRGIGYIAPTGAGTRHTGIIYGVWLSRGNMEKDKLVITFKYDHPLGSTDPKGKLLQGVAKWLESRHPELLKQVEDVVAEGGVKAALADFMEDLPKEMVAEIKKIIKLSVVNPTEVMKRKNKIEAIRKKYKIAPDFMGTPTAEVIVDYFNTFHGESVEVKGLTEAPYKTSTGTPKFVGKYQFTPFVEGSISGWFLRVQGFAKEVGFVEKPASKNTKTSVAPYKVYFHTEVSGHPQLKANALPGNETRVIQSNQFRFAPKQLLKGVAMWMDAYGYRMVGEGLESVDFHEGREWNIKYGTSMKDVVDEMGRSGWKPVGKMPSGNFSGNISFRKGQSKAHLVLKGGNPEKWVHESVEVVDGDINEAKKKLTSDQKAALKAYKLSCDMRDRDDLTPDMYRHYDKRAKADAEACKKLGLGKEDGVYESVHEDSTQVIEGRIKQHDSVYFDSYTAALAAARAKAEKKGYEIDEEDWASQVTHGYPGRPSVGKTTNKKINLTKNGKPVKPRLIISVYGMKNQFELTSYISESVEVESEDTSLIEATYSKAKAKNRKKIVDGIKKVLNGEMSKQDFMRLIGAESEDHPMVVKTMAKMKDLVAKRTTIQLKAK